VSYRGFGMRKHQQRQILELLETIENAQNENYFADCQDGAIAVGEFIEILKGEGTETVALLEEYCDLLFKAHNGEIGTKPLEKQLLKIKNTANFELKPDRVEMVFLSYKASMSDCLESIYLAAKENPSCDAYWIPIPYITRNPDGTEKEKHFEGADYYPSYIECTDWQEYNIEEQHPDVVFTYYPYDSGNNVTSISPDYYCERLRNVSEMLVYVPYFVVGGSVLTEAFALTPGCIYAEKIMVESEQIREQYIEVFKKEYGEIFGKAEDKFITIGSPKYDKIINTTREESALPPEWAKLVKNKKIILYNTTVTSIIQGQEKYLQKLKQVIDAFSERDDVVLWWRPHPLMIDAFESMRPALAAEYKATVKKYRESKIGIYDDTVDMHRAIAWSDAYYGDGNSLVHLYALTGKPIVMQTEAFIDYDEPAIAFESFIFDKDGIGWTYSLYFNGLFRLDFERNTAKLLAKDTEAYFSHPYLSIAEGSGKLIMFPFYGESILECNQKTGNMGRIALSKEYSDNSSGADRFMISLVIELNGKYYAFGQQEGVIVVYNPKTAEVEYRTEFRDAMIKKSQDGKLVDKPAFLQHLVGSKMLVVMREIGELVEYDLETCEITKIASFEKLITSERLFNDGKFIWIVDKDHDSIGRWDYSIDEFKTFDKFPEGFIANKDLRCFSGILDCGEDLLMLPLYANMAIRLNKSSGKMSREAAIPVPRDDKCNIYKYDFNYQTRDGKFFIFARFNSTVYELDTKTPDTVIPHKFTISDEDYDKYMQSVINSGSMQDLHYYSYILSDYFINGNPAELLAKLLPVMDESKQKQRAAFAKEIVNSDGTSGKSIFDMCRELVSEK